MSEQGREMEGNNLIDEMAFALMKWWFPKNKPTGDDLEKWTEIALGDSNAIYEHLKEIGVIQEHE